MLMPLEEVSSTMNWQIVQLHLIGKGGFNNFSSPAFGMKVDFIDRDIRREQGEKLGQRHIGTKR